MNKTLELNGSSVSLGGLTITSYPGETAVLSGGVPLNNLVWKSAGVANPAVRAAVLPAEYDFVEDFSTLFVPRAGTC